MSPFSDAVNKAMLKLAGDERTVFVGQSVCYDGAAIFDSLKGVRMGQRIEMPVAEDFQMGFCTGLALAGKFPICIFPRMDFMLLCMNQLVNHLDKLPIFGWHPKLIIRAAVGRSRPLDAGPQHTQNYTLPLRHMTSQNRLWIEEARTPTEVTMAYAEATERTYPTLIVENSI